MLDEDIKKNQTLLNKYRQIREKIKIEQTTMTRLKDSQTSTGIPEEKIKILSGKLDDDILKP
jgi:capsular polysaccharide biosynthesis protein